MVYFFINITLIFTCFFVGFKDAIISAIFKTCFWVSKIDFRVEWSLHAVFNFLFSVTTPPYTHKPRKYDLTWLQSDGQGGM